MEKIESSEKYTIFVPGNNSIEEYCHAANVTQLVSSLLAYSLNMYCGTCRDLYAVRTWVQWIWAWRGEAYLMLKARRNVAERNERVSWGVAMGSEKNIWTPKANFWVDLNVDRWHNMFSFLTGCGISLAIFNLLKGSKKHLWLHPVAESSGVISHLW